MRLPSCIIPTVGCSDIPTRRCAVGSKLESARRTGLRLMGWRLVLLLSELPNPKFGSCGRVRTESDPIVSVKVRRVI